MHSPGNAGALLPRVRPGRRPVADAESVQPCVVGGVHPAFEAGEVAVVRVRQLSVGASTFGLMPQSVFTSSAAVSMTSAFPSSGYAAMAACE